ncbi:MAG: DUF692 domain-containing protein [Deltaproteobacteria bacterium]|nr:MAG: DUF692 domain-containing protein [Deltaproteobacteria bacterium]
MTAVSQPSSPISSPHPSWLQELPSLGVGIGYRPPYRTDLFLHRKAADFLEITIEHFLHAPPEKDKELQLLQEHFTLIPHGLNLSLGSAEGVDERYVEDVARFLDRLNTPWWSEHIAWTQTDGIAIGHLSPVPFSEEAIETISRNLETVQRTIKTPLILENITYPFAVPGSTLTETEFLNQLMETTSCGLLLDLTNVFTNGTNHGFNPTEYLQQLPLERVVQLHFVGGHWSGDVLIDSHSHPTPPEVWELMDTVLKLAPVKGAILERDENLPPFQDIVSELEKARSLGQKYERWG